MEKGRRDRKRDVTQTFRSTQVPLGEQCLWNILLPTPHLHQEPRKGRWTSLGAPTSPLAARSQCSGQCLPGLHQPGLGSVDTGGRGGEHYPKNARVQGGAYPRKLSGPRMSQPHLKLVLERECVYVCVHSNACMAYCGHVCCAEVYMCLCIHTLCTCIYLLILLINIY